MAVNEDGDVAREKEPQVHVIEVSPSLDSRSTEEPKPTSPPPLQWKILAVVMISCISFGSAWGTGIMGALKSTLKRELDINNKQFSLLEASEDFMVTVMIVFSGILTDKIGGAQALLYGNVVYSIGTIVIASAAQVRSFKIMVSGRIILALGEIATRVAQFRVFSSWFSPNHGFASTLGIELGIKKIGGFVGKSSANIIAKKTGDFAWVFWVSVMMNVFANMLTFVFYWLNGIARKKFGSVTDPATGEKLIERSEKFQPRKVMELPWVFWAIVAFSLFETSTDTVFTQNATELAEKKFHTDSVTAGWYSAALQYGGFFLAPCVGAFIDVLGNRITLIAMFSTGVFIAIALVNWATDGTKGMTAAFVIYAVALELGPTTLIDSVRTSMWHGSDFGSAYAVKFAVNNATSMIVRIITGAIQDADNDSYDHVVIVYLVLATAALLVAIMLVVLMWWSVDLGSLQWTRKQRVANGRLWNERKRAFYGEKGERNRTISKICFGCLILLILGSWCAFFWGVATNNTD